MDPSVKNPSEWTPSLLRPPRISSSSPAREIKVKTGRILMLRFAHLKVLQGFLNSQRRLFGEVDHDVQNHSHNFYLVL